MAHKPADDKANGKFVEKSVVGHVFRPLGIFVAELAIWSLVAAIGGTVVCIVLKFLPNIAASADWMLVPPLTVGRAHEIVVGVLIVALIVPLLMLARALFQPFRLVDLPD